MKKPYTRVIVPWHNRDQLTSFLNAWRLDEWNLPSWVQLQQDATKAGCAATKNAGIVAAMAAGVEIVIILDDDCYPSWTHDTLEQLVERHIVNLTRNHDVKMFQEVTRPASRGTPYYNQTISMPAAASMGFWEEIGDYDAPGQLVHGANKEMEFRLQPIFGRYFPLCGMNLAFKPLGWWPWCRFIDTPRFDDIWMGWIFQRRAYDLGFCFALDGPVIRHSRQSNVWANLRDEAKWLEQNETLWLKIATAPNSEYETLRQLLPV